MIHRIICNFVGDLACGRKRPEDVSSGGEPTAERSDRSGMGSLGAAHSAGPAGGRKTEKRSAMNAISYLLRTGSPWRYLLWEVFPPRSTVYNIFRAFQRQGVWEAIWEALRLALRERLGREASPSAGVIDNQSLKSAEKGDVRKVKQTQWVMMPVRG
jgi:transposase